MCLGAAFAFTGAACGDNVTSSVPQSDSTPSTSTGGDDNKSELSRSYITGAIDQLSAAQSLKATFSVDVNVSDSAPSAYKLEEKTTGELIISQSDSGINAKISLTSKGKSSQSGHQETIDEKWEAYLIDGFVYEYDPANGYYEISRFDLNLPFSEGLTEVMKTGPVSFDMGGTTDGQDELIEILASLLETKGTVEESSASLDLSYDVKDSLNAGITFINLLNSAENLEEAIDLVLGMLAPDLTVNAILDVVKPLGAQTLGQITALLDIYLASQGTSLSEIKNSLLDMEEVQTFLDTIFAAKVAEGTLSENFIEEWKTKSVNEILTDLEVDGITINELLGALIGGETTEPFDLAKFIDEVVKPYLKNHTLEDIGLSLPVLDGIAVTKADTDIQIDFGADKKIKGVEFGFDLGATQEQETEGGNYVSTSSLSASFKIEEISAAKADIALPADAVCVYAIWNDNLTVDLGETDDFAEICFMPLDASAEGESEYRGVINIYNEIGDYVGYEFTYLPPQSLAEDSMTITIVAGKSGNLLTDDKQNFDDAKLKSLFGDSLTAEISLYLEYGEVDLSEFPGYVGWNA